MFNLLEGVQIYLAAGATDMRNSITGLSYLVEKRIKRNPRDRQLYLFCNRDRNRLKFFNTMTMDTGFITSVWNWADLSGPKKRKKQAR